MKAGVIKGIENIITHPNMDEGEKVFQIKNLIYESEIYNTKPRESKTISDLFTENLNVIKNGTTDDKVIKTGFKDLDGVIGGFSYGEFNVFASRPGMGKTVLLVNLVLKISETIPVLYFTFDVSESLLTSRFLSTLSNIPLSKIVQQNLTMDEKELLISLEEKISKQKVFINSSCNNSITAMKEHCLKQIRENGVKVIVVDYIQMMGSNRNRNNRELEISYVSRELKNIAKDNDVCVIGTSLLSRNSERREGNRPQLNDLSESGAIEQNADKVMMIYRPEYYGLDEDEQGNSTKNIMELLIKKNRNGPIDNIKLQRDSEFTTITDFNEYSTGFAFSQNRLDELDRPPF